MFVVLPASQMFCVTPSYFTKARPVRRGFVNSRPPRRPAKLRGHMRRSAGRVQLQHRLVSRTWYTSSISYDKPHIGTLYFSKTQVSIPDRSTDTAAQLIEHHHDKEPITPAQQTKTRHQAHRDRVDDVKGQPTASAFCRPDHSLHTPPLQQSFSRH